ncbi:hypothetical protein Leryth_023387, partial [Lithospermum erythrorhizon]
DHLVFVIAYIKSINPKVKSKSHFKHSKHQKNLSTPTTMNIANYMPMASDSCRKSCHRKSSFRRRCLTMAKQQKTRIYILRRCVVMLLCWSDHSTH